MPVVFHKIRSPSSSTYSNYRQSSSQKSVFHKIDNLWYRQSPVCFPENYIILNSVIEGQFFLRQHNVHIITPPLPDLIHHNSFTITVYLRWILNLVLIDFLYYMTILASAKLYQVEIWNIVSAKDPNENFTFILMKPFDRILK